jgi:hypothetical protein
VQTAGSLKKQQSEMVFLSIPSHEKLGFGNSFLFENGVHLAFEESIRKELSAYTENTPGVLLDVSPLQFVQKGINKNLKNHLTRRYCLFNSEHYHRKTLQWNKKATQLFPF